MADENTVLLFWILILLIVSNCLLLAILLLINRHITNRHSEERYKTMLRILILLAIFIMSACGQEPPPTITPAGNEPVTPIDALKEISILPGLGIPPAVHNGQEEDVWRNNTLWFLAWIPPLGNISGNNTTLVA